MLSSDTPIMMQLIGLLEALSRLLHHPPSEQLQIPTKVDISNTSVYIMSELNSFLIKFARFSSQALQDWKKQIVF